MKQTSQAYWAYLEIVIDFSSPIQRPDDRAIKQKRFSRSLGKDSSGAPPPLRNEGEIHSSTEKKAEILNQRFISVLTQ